MIWITACTTIRTDTIENLSAAADQSELRIKKHYKGRTQYLSQIHLQKYFSYYLEKTNCSSYSTLLSSSCFDCVVTCAIRLVITSLFSFTLCWAVSYVPCAPLLASAASSAPASSSSSLSSSSSSAWSGWGSSTSASAAFSAGGSAGAGAGWFSTPPLPAAGT